MVDSEDLGLLVHQFEPSFYELNLGYCILATVIELCTSTFWVCVVEERKLLLLSVHLLRNVAPKRRSEKAR